MLFPTLGRVQGLHLAGMLGLILLAWNLNAGRVRLLVGGMDCCRLSHWQALGVVMATEFAISATPGGSGGPPTYGYLLQQHGLTPAHALAIYTVDQLVDMLFFLSALVVIAASNLWAPTNWYAGQQILFLGGLIVLGLAFFVGLVRHYRQLLLFIGRMLRRLGVGARGRRWMMRRILEYRLGLLRVRRFPPSRLWAVYGLCVGHWLLRYSILYLAVREVGGMIDWTYAFLVQMLSLSIGQATLMPGGSGGAEASAGLLLLPHLTAGTAAGAVLIWRFVTFYWYLIAGAPVFALLAGRPAWRGIQRQTTD